MQIVAAFSRSGYRRRDLAKAQIQLKLPAHTLKSDSPTRWGSKADMIVRFLEQEQAVRQVITNSRKISHLQMSWHAIDLLKEVSAALTPLNDLTNTLSGDKYITVSTVIPMLSILQDISDEAKTAKASKITVLILDTVRAYMDNRYDKTTKQLLHMCTVLDPSYKSSFLTKEEDIEAIKIKIINEVGELCPSMDKEDTAAEQSSEHDDNDEPPRKKSLTDRLRVKVLRFATSTGECANNKCSMIQVKRELENYLVSPCLPLESESLLWWRSNQSCYPHLAALAKKLLSIPATSTTSERLFSTAGNVITSKRNRINPERAEQLIFLNRNLDDWP